VARGNEIDEASMQGAVELVKYFKSHAKKVYGSVAKGRDNSRIGQAVKWIKSQGSSVSVREIQQRKLTGVRNAEEAEELATALVELGYATLEEFPKKRKVVTLIS